MMRKKTLGEEQGSVMIMVVIALLVLIGFTGLVVDGGSMYMTKSKLQNAADAAALAGCQYVKTSGIDESNAIDKAIIYAGINGVVAEEVDVEVEPAELPIISYEPVYDDSGLATLESTLRNDFSLSTDDSDLLEYAEYYGITVGMDVKPAHNAADVEAKEAELTTQYNGMSDDNLEIEAQAKSLDDYLQTSAQLAAELYTMSDADVIAYAAQHGITLGNEYVRDGVFKKRDDAIAFIVNTRNGGNDLIIKDKSGLIGALITRGTTYFANETISTIVDKTGLINAVIERIIDEREHETVEVHTGGHPGRVKVTCTREVKNSFMSVLGFPKSTVSAIAVAEPGPWAGDALPFINLDGHGEKGQPLVAWNMTGPGDKERIYNGDLIIANNRIMVKYADGYITFEKGKDLSKISGPLEKIVSVGKTVYLFSIKEDEIENYQKGGSKELKQEDEIPLADVEILECIVLDDWDRTASDLIDLEFVNSYTWDEADEVFKDIYDMELTDTPILVK